MKGVKPVSITTKSSFRPYQIQYLLKPKPEAGLEPNIQDLLKTGVIVEFPYSPCNSPLFPVRKVPLSVEWKMGLGLSVQINKRKGRKHQTLNYL